MSSDDAIFMQLNREVDPINKEEAMMLESNLMTHARRELELIGEEKETIDGYAKVIQAFSDMGHSGMSASIMISALARLLNYENLYPLTNNPEEWEYHDEEKWGQPGGIWQNRRNPKAFSTDAGVTYKLLGDDGFPKTVHYSKIGSWVTDA